MKGRGNIEKRGGGVRVKQKGNERELVAGLKRRCDFFFFFLLNMVLKPAALNKYSTDCVPSAPAAYGAVTKPPTECKTLKS